MYETKEAKLMHCWKSKKRKKKDNFARGWQGFKSGLKIQQSTQACFCFSSRNVKCVIMMLLVYSPPDLHHPSSLSHTKLTRNQYRNRWRVRLIGEINNCLGYMKTLVLLVSIKGLGWVSFNQNCLNDDSSCLQINWDVLCCEEIHKSPVLCVFSLAWITLYLSERIW